MNITVLIRDHCNPDPHPAAKRRPLSRNHKHLIDVGIPTEFETGKPVVYSRDRVFIKEGDDARL